MSHAYGYVECWNQRLETNDIRHDIKDIVSDARSKSAPYMRYKEVKNNMKYINALEYKYITLLRERQHHFKRLHNKEDVNDDVNTNNDELQSLLIDIRDAALNVMKYIDDHKEELDSFLFMHQRKRIHKHKHEFELKLDPYLIEFRNIIYEHNNFKEYIFRAERTFHKLKKYIISYKNMQNKKCLSFTQTEMTDVTSDSDLIHIQQQYNKFKEAFTSAEADMLLHINEMKSIKERIIKTKQAYNDFVTANINALKKRKDMYKQQIDTSQLSKEEKSNIFYNIKVCNELINAFDYKPKHKCKHTTDVNNDNDNDICNE